MLIDIYNSECVDKAAPDGGPSSSADLSLQTQHISISDLIECRKHKIFTGSDICGVNKDRRMVYIDCFNENFSQYIPHSLKVQMDLQIKCQHLFDKCDQLFDIYISRIILSTNHFICNYRCNCTIAEKLKVSRTPRKRAAPDSDSESVLLNPNRRIASESIPGNL